MKKKYVRIFRNNFTNMQLPFFPRGSGINYFEFNDCEKQNSCNFCEINWVAEGSCKFSNGKDETIVSKDGWYFWLPGEPHGKLAIASGPTEVYYATFDGDRASELLQSYGYERSTSSSKCMIPLFTRIMHGLVSPLEAEYRNLIPAYMELMTLMEEPAADSNITTDHFVNECLYLIHSECGNCDFNIDSLAEHMKVHRSTIRRTILRATGKTPLVFLNECRVERGLELLKTTSLPVKVIADWSGFRRANYFCHAVRMATGYSPAVWRDRI